MTQIVFSLVLAVILLCFTPVEYCRERIRPVRRSAQSLAKGLVCHLRKQYRYDARLNRDDGGPTVVNFYCSVGKHVDTCSLGLEIAACLRRFRLKVEVEDIQDGNVRLVAFCPKSQFVITLLPKPKRREATDECRRFYVGIEQRRLAA